MSVSVGVPQMDIFYINDQSRKYINIYTYTLRDDNRVFKQMCMK